MSRDAETDAVEAVKQLSLLESTLLRHRTLTIFGEINKDVAQRGREAVQEEDCMRAVIYARMSTDKESADPPHGVGR